LNRFAGTTSSAERMWRFAGDAGVDVRHLLPWNAYPW
jgi:hypothetical protein